MTSNTTSIKEFASVLSRISYLNATLGANPLTTSIVVVLRGNEIEYFAHDNALEFEAIIRRARSLTLLRHYYASALVKQGVSLQMMAALLGHSDTRTTEKHYAHLQPKDVAEVLQNNLPKLEV